MTPRDFTSEQFRRAGLIRGVSAREVPAPPSARGVRTGPTWVRPRQARPSRNRHGSTDPAHEGLSPPSALGVRAGGVPRPSPCRPTASRDVLHRRARIPAPRHETSRHRKMRFHRVIILEAVAPHGVIRSAAMNCGLPRSVSVAWARREADTFPVLAHACQDLIPVRSAGGGRHGPPPRKNRDKGSKENRVRPPHRKRKGHTECGVPFSTSWGG